MAETGVLYGKEKGDSILSGPVPRLALLVPSAALDLE